MAASQISANSPAPAAQRTAPRLTITVENFTPLRSQTQVGFADIAIPELGLRVVGIAIHASGENRWISLRDSVARCDGHNVILEVADPGSANCFSQMAIRALLQAFSDAFAITDLRGPMGRARSDTNLAEVLP